MVDDAAAVRRRGFFVGQMPLMEEALNRREQLTPKTGANLCEIDDFEFPPFNLILLRHFEDVASAERARLSPTFAGRTLVILPSDG